jgi:hypothetical protein
VTAFVAIIDPVAWAVAVPKAAARLRASKEDFIEDSDKEGKEFVV